MALNHRCTLAKLLPYKLEIIFRLRAVEFISFINVHMFVGLFVLYWQIFFFLMSCCLDFFSFLAMFVCRGAD